MRFTMMIFLLGLFLTFGLVASVNQAQNCDSSPGPEPDREILVEHDCVDHVFDEEFGWIDIWGSRSDCFPTPLPMSCNYDDVSLYCG